MEQQIQQYANILTSKKWIYKSEGKWNEKIFNFNDNYTVNIEDDNGEFQWGVDGIALWFKVIQGYIINCYVVTQITDDRIDLVKINSDERVYMLKECDD